MDQLWAFSGGAEKRIPPRVLQVEPPQGPRARPRGVYKHKTVEWDSPRTSGKPKSIPRPSCVPMSQNGIFTHFFFIKITHFKCGTVGIFQIISYPNSIPVIKINQSIWGGAAGSGFRVTLGRKMNSGESNTVSWRHKWTLPLIWGGVCFLSTVENRQGVLR